MKIIAFDPGYDRLGWAVGETQNLKLKVKSFGCITTSKEDTLFHRYRIIIDEVEKLLIEHEPTQAATESLFFFSNQKTAMKVAEVRGIITGCLLKRNIEISEYTPIQIKQAAAGHGRADKVAVDKMVRLQLNLNPKEKIIDDTIDALAILLTHSIRSQSKLI